MKKLLVSLIFVAIFAVLLLGCSQTTTTPSSTTSTTTSTLTSSTTAPKTSTSTTAMTSTTTAAAAPHGELVYAVPTLGAEDFSYNQNPNMVLPTIVYERMFRTNRNTSEPMGIYPLLAERYTKSDDGLTYDVYLRQGIQWQGGYGEMTADDVVYTFDIMKNPDYQNVYAFIFNPPDQGGYMTSYEAIDKYHVRFHLSKPYNMFLIDMTDVPCYIICKAYIEKVGWAEAVKHPIGTGPWEWVETVSGDHVKFQAFDKYWGQMPGFKYLTLKAVPDISTQMMMLQSGEADMAILSPEQAPDAINSGLQLLNVPNESMVAVFFGGQILPSWKTYDPTVPWVTHWDEPADSAWNQRALKVREALCLSIDPQVIVDKIMHGYASVDTMRDFIKTSPNFLPAWQPYPYDRTKAKELLAEAGYPNGLPKPIQVLIPSLSQAGIDTKAIALYAADSYEAIGLKVDRQVMDPNLISQTWEFGREDAWKSEVSVGFGIIKPVWGSQMALASWSPMHEVAESPTFDQLVTQYTVAQDPAEAVKIEQQIGTFEYNNYMARGLFYSGFLYFFGPKVKDAAKIPLPYWQESEVLPFFDYEYVEPAQ